MPLEIIYLDDGGILIKASGDLAGSDIAECNRQIYETPEEVRAIVYQICDFTDVDRLSFTPDDIRGLAADDRRAAEINPHMLIAIVGSDDLTFGLARMWEAQVREPALETSVFRRIEDAEQWITIRTKGRE